MHFVRCVAPLILMCGCATVDRTQEIEAARGLFEANIAAIQNKDRGAYLACYLNSPELVRVGPDGAKNGFEELATTTSTAPETWPVSLRADDMTLSWSSPGVVFGTYAYEVVFQPGDDPVHGVSERIFTRTDEGWRIAVTTAFPTEAKKKD